MVEQHPAGGGRPVEDRRRTAPDRPVGTAGEVALRQEHHPAGRALDQDRVLQDAVVAEELDARAGGVLPVGREGEQSDRRRDPVGLVDEVGVVADRLEAGHRGPRAGHAAAGPKHEALGSRWRTPRSRRRAPSPPDRRSWWRSPGGGRAPRSLGCPYDNRAQQQARDGQSESEAHARQPNPRPARQPSRPRPGGGERNWAPGWPIRARGGATDNFGATMWSGSHTPRPHGHSQPSACRRPRAAASERRVS